MPTFLCTAFSKLLQVSLLPVMPGTSRRAMSCCSISTLFYPHLAEKVAQIANQRVPHFTLHPHVLVDTRGHTNHNKDSVERTFDIRRFM